MTDKTDQAFQTIRQAVSTHSDKEGATVALAVLDIAEEFLAKLDRIAFAAETLAETTATDSYGGHPFIRTSGT